MCLRIGDKFRADVIAPIVVKSARYSLFQKLKEGAISAAEIIDAEASAWLIPLKQV